MHTFKYQEKNSFERRLAEANRIRERYENKIPVIIELSPGEKNIDPIDKNKFLVPSSMSLGDFMLVIRRRIKLTSESALYLFIVNEENPAGILGSCGQIMDTLYDSYKSNDNFLYITYNSENTFGFSV